MPTTNKNAAAAKNKIVLPENYKPSEKEAYMSPSQLEYFRQKLVNWRNELLEESRETLDHLKEENWQEPDINDRATVEAEASLELRTRNRYLKLLEKIDSALKRIDDGTYGFCEESGEEIGIKRLEARPIATLSIEAQERHESYERTHIDEDERF
jgi:DnaK suppressor protein